MAINFNVVDIEVSELGIQCEWSQLPADTPHEMNQNRSFGMEKETWICKLASSQVFPGSHDIKPTELQLYMHNTYMHTHKHIHAHIVIR